VLQDGLTPLDVAFTTEIRALLLSFRPPVPAEVAALLSRLCLSQYGHALVAELGVAFVSDLALFSEADLKEGLPAMKMAERKRLLAASKAGSPPPTPARSIRVSACASVAPAIRRRTARLRLRPLAAHPGPARSLPAARARSEHLQRGRILAPT